MYLGMEYVKCKPLHSADQRLCPKCAIFVDCRYQEVTTRKYWYRSCDDWPAEPYMHTSNILTKCNILSKHCAALPVMPGSVLAGIRRLQGLLMACLSYPPKSALHLAPTTMTRVCLLYMYG